MPASDSNTASCLLHFRDPRPPQEIRFDLERELMIILPPKIEAGRLEHRTIMKVNNVACDVVLRYEAALAQTNGYSLCITMPLAGAPPESRASMEKSLTNWFGLWTRHFSSAPPSGSGDSKQDRYDEQAAQAMTAESQMTSVSDLQQEILAALRGGASYSTAHKEGGTTISFQHGRFVRADYGESNTRDVFTDETSFLAFLEKFFQWETSRNSPTKEPQALDRWKLILRLLRSQPHGKGARVVAGHSTTHWLLAFVVAAIAVGALVWLRGGPSWFHRFHQEPIQKLDKVDGIPPDVKMPTFKMPELPKPPPAK